MIFNSQYKQSTAGSHNKYVNKNTLFYDSNSQSHGTVIKALNIIVVIFFFFFTGLLCSDSEHLSNNSDTW